MITPDQGHRRHRSHRFARIIGLVIVIAVIFIFGVVAGAFGAGSKAAPAPSPAVTVTAPAQPAPAVTVTETAAPSASPGQVLLKRSGSGNWNSPPFQVSPDSPQLQVTYRYSGNYSSGSADNFSLVIKSADDDNLVDNTISGSGGTTTDVYPDTSSGDTTYHLEMGASGSWSVTITEVS
jgi:hypothetical protein